MVSKLGRNISIEHFDDYKKLPTEVKHNLFLRLNKREASYMYVTQVRSDINFFKKVKIAVQSFFEGFHNAAKSYNLLQGKVIQKTNLNFNQAILNKILSDSDELMIKGMEYLRLKQFPNAEAIFKELLTTFDQKNEFYLSLLATAYHEQNKLEKALQTCQEILPKLEHSIFQDETSEKQAASIFILIATIYKKQGDTQKALATLDKASEIAKKRDDGNDLIADIEKLRAAIHSNQ